MLVWVIALLVAFTLGWYGGEWWQSQGSYAIGYSQAKVWYEQQIAITHDLHEAKVNDIRTELVIAQQECAALVEQLTAERDRRLIEKGI